MERSKSDRMSLLRKIKPQKLSSEDLELRSSLPARPSRVPKPWSPSQVTSTCGTEGPLSGAELLKRFSGLHDVIVAHVHKHYSQDGAEKGISQSVIEHASTGISLPWPQILGLLGDGKTRMAMLTMCIAWTILSRSLLLKLGTSNSPGSTFLPPEIVECFQSFSLGKGAVTLGKGEPNAVNFALLSHWKQATAALCHKAYVADAFTFFDARTVNIERALKDLDPLLATYAKPDDVNHGKDARVDDLRDVLRLGASFAFTLFGQPCFWKFDWRSGRAIAHGKTETEPDSDSFLSTTTTNVAATTSIGLTTEEIVAWPSLVRAMDEDGAQLGECDDTVLGKKKYVGDIAGKLGSVPGYKAYSLAAPIDIGR
ncbi:hypothetical protein PMIN07_002355 [Paraphaeosphaeria minitans]